MTVVQAVENLCEWVEKEVAEKILLKLPNDDLNTHTYQMEQVHPSVFAMLLPPSDKTEKMGMQEAPSITVQLLNGSEEGKSTGRMDIRFRLISWTPGLHGEEFLIPKEEGGLSYTPWTGEEAENHYKRSATGWLEEWNMVDSLVTALRESPFIGGLQKDPETSIQYGQEADSDQIISYYPYWVAWVTCSFLYGAEKSGRAFEALLE